LKKVILAYSGGLDTSVCIPLLRERYGYDEVVTVTVDVGQSPDEIRDAEERGRMLSDKHVTIDAKKEAVYDYIFPLIKANGNYEGYVLGTAVLRPLMARKVVEVAKDETAGAVAHGCTGKGNDQLRFDAVFRTTSFDVVAPIRELSLTRAFELEYATEHGINVKNKKWSIDENIWSRSIEGGGLENPASTIPDEVFEWTSSPENTPDPRIIEIVFENGVPVSLDGKKMDGVKLIKELNRIAGEHGVGRSDIVEDRVLGLKSRENYEHPAATVLLKVHKDLEQLVLTRNELRFKEIADRTWAELVYRGLTMDPLFDDLGAFIEKTQVSRVSGKVKMKLAHGSVRVIARESPYALLSREVSFDEETDQSNAEGYSMYHGFQSRLYHKISP
jgi:argininosuccinate synthase